MIEKTKILKITVFIVLFRAALPSWATRYNGEFFESLRNIYLYIVMNLFYLFFSLGISLTYQPFLIPPSQELGRCFNSPAELVTPWPATHLSWGFLWVDSKNSEYNHCQPVFLFQVPTWVHLGKLARLSHEIALPTGDTDLGLAPSMSPPGFLLSLEENRECASSSQAERDFSSSYPTQKERRAAERDKRGRPQTCSVCNASLLPLETPFPKASQWWYFVFNLI